MKISQKLLKIKLDFKTSYDKKKLLTEIKNFTGNVVSDEDLFKYVNLSDNDFKKISEIFSEKKEENQINRC